MGKSRIINVYQKRASTYNSDVKLFNLIGWRVNYYREIAVQLMNLKKGNTVIDLCCGTGLNFPHLYKAVGDEGKIIGIDLSAHMLNEGQKQVNKQGWKNVTLINADAAQFNFPKGINGIISSYAISLIPEYDAIIQAGSKSLTTGGRFIILDFKKPDKWPDWFSKLMVLLFIKPYGGTYEMKDRHAWESLEKYLHLVDFREYYSGSTYVATGEKKNVNKKNT